MMGMNTALAQCSRATLANSASSASERLRTSTGMWSMSGPGRDAVAAGAPLGGCAGGGGLSGGGRGGGGWGGGGPLVPLRPLGPLGPRGRGCPPQARGGAKSGLRQRRGCLAVGARQRRRAGMQGGGRASCAGCGGARGRWGGGGGDMQRVGGGMWRFGSSGGWFARRPPAVPVWQGSAPCPVASAQRQRALFVERIHRAQQLLPVGGQ